MTILIALMAALFVVNGLTPWGLATFGLLGWWMASILIGVVIAVVSVLLGAVVKALRP